MSTKLQTALCTMTVNMEAPRSGQAGFQISKTVRFSGAPYIFSDVEWETEPELMTPISLLSVSKGYTATSVI
jgi:hypothetical protein